MREREERIARNEALFREVNERVREVPAEDSPEERTGFLCECGDADCTETIELTIAEYEAVRSDPRRFFVLPGHVIPEVEDVIEETDRFAVVRKHPEEAAIAEETDPRSGR